MTGCADRHGGTRSSRTSWRPGRHRSIATPICSPRRPSGINLHVGTPNIPEPGTRPTGPVSVGADAPVAAASRQDLRCTGYGEELTSCQLLRDGEGRRIGRLSRLDLGDVVLLTATMRMTDGGTVTIDASNSTADTCGSSRPPLPTSRRSRSRSCGTSPPTRCGRATGPDPPSPPGAGRLRRPAPGVLRPLPVSGSSNASPSTLLTCGPPTPSDALSSRSAESSAGRRGPPW